MSRVLYEKRKRIGYITLNRPEALNALDDALRLETLNAYSSLGDFSEARQRLSQFYAKDKARQAAIDSFLHRGAAGRGRTQFQPEGRRGSWNHPA
jgi:hypothetical protein